MTCPKCGFVDETNALECGRCGIVIAKYHGARPVAAAEPASDPAQAERLARAVATPASFLVAWIAVTVAPGAVRMLTMWVHESGHAVAAWLCGYAAWPGPWFTPVAMDRSAVVTIVLVSALGAGAWRAWQIGRWFWVAAASIAFALTLVCTFALRPGQAQQLIVFAGDGGSLVFGAALMLTIYARADHPIRREQLRWAFVILGALAVVDAWTVWGGSLDRLPFGENENGLSDPSVLTEEFGWSPLALVNGYLRLAHACVAVVGGAWLAGVIAALRSRGSDT